MQKVSSLEDEVVAKNSEIQMLKDHRYLAEKVSERMTVVSADQIQKLRKVEESQWEINREKEVLRFHCELMSQKIAQLEALKNQMIYDQKDLNQDLDQANAAFRLKVKEYESLDQQFQRYKQIMADRQLELEN